MALIIVTVAALWFYNGNISVDCKEVSVKIKGSYWADTEINYSQMDTVLYRRGLDVGTRKFGVGTAKLSVGTYQNDEFGTYTLYAYADAAEFIVLTAHEQTIVIGLCSAQETKAIYETMVERVGRDDKKV